jgi:hypothetical protein
LGAGTHAAMAAAEHWACFGRQIRRGEAHPFLDQASEPVLSTSTALSVNFAGGSKGSVQVCGALLRNSSPTAMAHPLRIKRQDNESRPTARGFLGIP